MPRARGRGRGRGRARGRGRLSSDSPRVRRTRRNRNHYSSDEEVEVHSDAGSNYSDDEGLREALNMSLNTILDVGSQEQRDLERAIQISLQDNATSSNSITNGALALNENSSSQPTVLNNEQMAKKMESLFQSSLRRHLDGKYMAACKAVKTKLYPHQMFALAWMTKRESNRDVKGGILADDMGLGKTLTTLALIMTNFHDKKSLARPIPGVRMKLDKNILKYLPKPKMPTGSGGVVKKSSKNSNGSKSFDSFRNLFGKNSGRKKDFNLPIKSSSSNVNFINNDDDFDMSLLSDEEDEFDSMIKSASLSQRLGVSSEDINSSKKKTVFHHNDGLSSDEEYQNMTPEERNKKMRPTLNLDGATSLSESDDGSDSDGPFVPTKKRKVHEILSDDANSDCNEPTEIPQTPILQKRTFVMPELTPKQKKNLIIPNNQPAICGKRRRPTLIVTPASLVIHWLQQIVEHVDNRVELSVFLHYGQSKALVKSELEDKDIVLTTYGSLVSELDQRISPILTTRWLRVILDEGHNIKNHRTKTAKAAKQLDTERKWIISGTPIQNNLRELWSLLLFLDVEPYATDRVLFKMHFEDPFKYGHPRAFERLQTLMDVICLRRSKEDKINGKPIVDLPQKTVNLVKLEFTEEEKAVYDVYHSRFKEQILKYLKKGTLLRNYAHIFAVMMRLRQLCCHRELLPIEWKKMPIEKILQLAKEQADKEAREIDEGDSEAMKILAERLRDMIKEGISDECSICLADFNIPVITPCAHVYCKGCIVQVIETTEIPPARCPLCRGELKVERLQEAAPEEEKDIVTTTTSETCFEDIDIHVSSTKVNALIKELVRIRRDFPNDKTVIVSQFTSFLSFIQPLLKEEGFTWVRLDGTMNMKERADVVAAFQDKSDESAKILLMSLRAGGVGLNLTRGNRLFLLDPAWNPSTEEQCFDRIHRLGQDSDVEITKFIMKDSIEEKMIEIQEKKKELISGAFRQSEEERQERRINDIRAIFGI